MSSQVEVVCRVGHGEPRRVVEIRMPAALDDALGLPGIPDVGMINLGSGQVMAISSSGTGLASLRDLNEQTTFPDQC
jgi:hypothetical protein